MGCFTMSYISYKLHVMNDTVKMLPEANKVMSELKSKKTSLKFPNLGKPINMIILTYSDATYTNLENGLPLVVLFFLFKIRT